jgi:hypothetical protein
VENVRDKEKMKSLAAAKEVAENLKRAKILENYDRNNQLRKQRRLKDRQNFVSVAMDTLKTPEMKICIADAFARDSRLTIIRSEERQTLAAIGALDVGLVNIDEGIEPEIIGDDIHVDNDRAFSAFRDPENSDSDYSDVEEGEDSL